MIKRIKKEKRQIGDVLPYILKDNVQLGTSTLACPLPGLKLCSSQFLPFKFMAKRIKRAGEQLSGRKKGENTKK
ncbi:hypothetical protein [Fictibacillus barbaricus]|uniref:Uncharacterized protein n=1 Tax=Fictibacillus barbaricus TaxID=182136 RepID=A0ABS2Z7L6_9BACL|nr:hypothetical protein [Fictibacillus barbaricus]MBN3543968.1 hypothetical protein [Fictibacillus barbaricus]